MMIRKKLAVLMLVGVTCLASGCGNVVKDGTEALGEGRYDAAETAFEEATKNENKEVAADGYQGLGMTYYEQKEYAIAFDADRRCVYLDRNAGEKLFVTGKSCGTFYCYAAVLLSGKCDPAVAGPVRQTE